MRIASEIDARIVDETIPHLWWLFVSSPYGRASYLECLLLLLIFFSRDVTRLAIFGRACCTVKSLGARVSEQSEVKVFLEQFHSMCFICGKSLSVCLQLSAMLQAACGLTL